MNDLLFVENPVSYYVRGSFWGYIPIVGDKQELFSRLSMALNFPNYFGYNWDALCEVYRDFSWIDDKEIIIVHENLSELKDTDLEVYMEIVMIAIDCWKMDDVHDLVFVFSENDKTRITHILNSITNS